MAKAVRIGIGRSKPGVEPSLIHPGKHRSTSTAEKVSRKGQMDRSLRRPIAPGKRSENLLYRNPLHITRAGFHAPGPV
jgi:hypothetical protein